MPEKDTLGHIKNLEVELKENLYEILHILACPWANFNTERAVLHKIMQTNIKIIFKNLKFISFKKSYSALDLHILLNPTGILSCSVAWTHV